MANNLGFEYTLKVNETATRQNLNTFIRNTFGEGKNAKLSVPIKLDISNSIRDIDFKAIQKDIDDNKGNNLKVKAKIVIDTNNIKNQLTSKIGEIEKDLKFKVGLEIDPSAINLISGTVDVMKTLNAEIDKVKDNMKELGKNLTINIGDVHLGKQYDEILETSKEIKEENKETEASLEEQLDIQKRILQEKRNQMKQTEKDIKSEEKRLNLAKERKANNDKLIEQEKQLRKEASNLDEQIKAEQDKQKTYEKQNDALKKQSKEQKKLADDLKKTNEEIKKLENDKTSAQQRVNLAKEEEQRRANNLEMMRKENEALKEKLANLQKIANVTNEATTVDKTNKTSKGSSIKQQANDAIKQVTNVSEKRIEQEKQVTNEIEKQSEAQIKAINNVTEAEDKANKAKAKSSSSTTKKSSTGKKSGGSKRRNLYEDVQSAEIAKAIHDETVQGVRSYEEERAEMRRLGDMIANERGLLQQVTECLERNKKLTKENADEVQNLLTKLADEKTLIQEAAGNRDYVNYADFKNALKKYQADPSDKNLEKLEWQMEKWGKIGAMYEYRKDVQEAINTLQKQYNIEAQRSIEIDKKQNQINEARTSQNTQKNEAKANNWLKGKFGKYKDAGSYMEEMVGFTKDELYDALLEYEEVIDKFRLQDDDAIDYEKTEKFFGRITKQINECKEAAAKATDERVINKYTEAIENLNNMITNTKKNINTWEELNRIYLADSDFDVTEDAKQKDVDLDKVLNLKETVSEFTQYSQAMNLAKEQTSEMRQDLSWLAKDFDKLVAEKSMDEEKWQSLADKVQQYKKELGVTEDQIRQFINTKNAEIEQGNEHLAKLKEVQKTLKRGTNEYRECSKVIKDYNNALKNDLPITDIIKDMKELINILDEGKDSFDNFSDTNSGEKTVKIVKKQQNSILEVMKAQEEQSIMAERVYLANKKNENAMIDIDKVLNQQKQTWGDLAEEVERYYKSVSSSEVDKAIKIMQETETTEKNPNYRVSSYMKQSLDAENLSLQEKIKLLGEYEAKSNVLLALRKRVQSVEESGLSYLEDEEDEIQRLNQKKQEQINKTINHTKATQNNNKALKEQADVSKNIAKIDVTQQNKNMQELFRSVALGDNNLENLSELLKLVKNEVEKFSLVLSSGTGLTDEARKSMYALKESFTKAEQALTTMEQKTGNANFTIEKGSKGFNTQKDILAKLYKEIYNVSESTQQSNQVEERANKIAEDKVNNTNKVVGAIKQETNAIDDKTMALKSMALQAGIAEEKLDDLLMRIGNVVGSGKRLSKTEMTKLAKDFPTEDLASASERRVNLISEGRKGKYNQTDEYKQRKGQLDALVANYTDNAFDLFQKIYDEAKKLDKLTEQTNRKITRTSKPKKQEVTQQNEVAKAVEGTTQAIQEQNETSTKVQDNHHAQMRQAVQDVDNITDAQQRFNKMLELTGLNYDHLYKRYLKEAEALDFQGMWKVMENMKLEQYKGEGYPYLKVPTPQVNFDDRNEANAAAADYDAVNEVVAQFNKLKNYYDYNSKEASQLSFMISEGLNDQLAIEIALRKTEEERLDLTEALARKQEELNEKLSNSSNNSEIKRLQQELKQLEQNEIYKDYNARILAEAKEAAKVSPSYKTDPEKTVAQTMWKIAENNMTNLGYTRDYGGGEYDKFWTTKEIIDKYKIKDVEALFDILIKINEVKHKIEDLQYQNSSDNEQRVVDKLKQEIATLTEEENLFKSMLPKQQEQVQVQQQQAQATTETAQAREKINTIVEDTQRTQEMTSEKEKAKLAESEYREELLKTQAVEESVAETCEQLCRQIINLVDAQGELAKSNKDEYEIFDSFKQDALYGFDNISSGDLAWTHIAEGMIKSAKELGIAVDEQEKAYQKEMELLQNQENIGVKKIADDEYIITEQRTKQIKQEEKIAEGIKSTRKELYELGSVYADIYANVMQIVEASEQFKELRLGSEAADAFKLLEEDAKYALESGLNEEYWQTLAESAIDSAKTLGVAVDEQEALFKQEIENYNKQIDLMAEQATFGNKIAEQKTEQVVQEEKIIGQQSQQAEQQEKIAKTVTETVAQEKNITEEKAQQVVQEEKVSEAISETVGDYKSAYEEVMRLIEASKEYSKLSEESSEKIDFQDLRDRAETIADDDVAQWKEMYQLSLALGDEMELNINRERQLAKEKQATLEKTKSLLTNSKTTEQNWKNEKEAIEKENSVIKENTDVKKQETNATEQLSKAQDKSVDKTNEVAKSKNKVTKASKQAKKALDDESKALIASTDVKDHIQAALTAIEKINDSATFKKKKKENPALQDMFGELKREANINKSSGILGIDYWDGLIDRIKIFATEMVKMKAKTIDDTVNPLIYKDGGTTSTTKTTSTSKPLSMEDFKAQQEEKAKQRQIRQQEKEARKLKEQREEAEALETVLKQLEDSIVNNPHTQLLKVYEDITKITDAQERFNKILEVTGLSYDEVYQKALKSERAHAQNSGGIDIDEIFTKQLASFNRDDNPYNTLNYMSVANIKGFNDRVDYVAEYRAKEKVLQKFINAIKSTTNEEKEFIAQQELEIKMVKAYPSEAKKMLDAQQQMAEANQEVSEKSKELVDNLENTTTQIEDTKEEIKELVSITKDINIDALKDNLGRTWQQIAEEERKALSKMKEDLLFFELNNMEMDGIYSDKNDASEKRYKAANYMDTTNFTAKNKKEAIDLLSEYYAKTLILYQLQQREQAILDSQVSNEDKIKSLEEERTSLLQRRKTYSEEELQALKKSKDNADEYYKSVKEASTEFAKIEEHAKSLNIKKEAMQQHIDGLIMQGMYYEKLGQTYKPLKEIGVDQTKLIQENEKSRTALSLRDSATNAYEKALESNKENAKIDARVAEIDKEIAQLKGEQTQEVEQQINVIEQQTEEVKQQANIVEQQKEDIQEQAIVIEQQTEDVKEQTNAIQEQAKVEEQKQVIDEKSKQIKQDKVEVENEEVKALQEQIAKNEELIKQEEEAMQDAKETATMHEMEVATINYKIKQAKELRDEQEKQLANANENSEKMKEEYKLQDEGIKRITEKIKALEEERNIKEQMANDLKQQILQEEALGNVSDDVLNSMIDDYNNLRKEAENTKKSIDLITTAIKNQKDYEEMSRTGVNPLQPINNSPQSAPNWTTGGRGGSNGGNGDDGSIREGKAYNEILSERTKLKQRALMLDIENLVYGKDLTDSQKLMVNELVEQVVQLGKSVTSMKELNLEAQKIKQNINETKFDVKVSTTEDKNAKKLLEQKRKETTEMYKGLFDIAIAQEEAKANEERERRNELTRMYTRLMDEAIAKEDARAKYVKEQTAMYTRLWEQYEKGVQAEERAKVVLEDKIAKQRDLWQLKVKEFSQSDNSNYTDPKDIANMKQMADNIGNNVTNMRELNQQLHEMSMAYKEISSNSKNTKAMFNDAEKAREEAEANKQAQKALKELIATKEEDLRQTHQNIVNGKAYREATDGQKQTFDAFKEQLKLTGATTEEVNNQYKTLVQTMNGMKIDMTTDALKRQNTIFGKLKETVKQYISLNFDAMDMLRYFTTSLNEAWEHTKALDEAYTNISMTMNVTNKQFETMKRTAMEVGNANGQLETSVLDMMKVYANAGTTVEEINSQMKATVAFQNVTDLDASAVTQSVQTIIQQYKLTENGAMSAAKATEYLGDVMVAVAYDLAKEESVAMQEVVAGIETAGNMIKTSGGSFEWFTSVIGTLSEVMNASGSETANAMKMIAARTLKSKEAIDDLTESGEDMEDIEIAASNAEKALNSIGLSARDSNGDFKDLEVILGEVAAKWGTLSNATKQYVSEQMAGNNRRSFFIGLMENYERVEELQTKAENSSGALMEASEKKANSLEGQLNRLQNAWYKMYEAMITSDTAKNIVGGLASILNVTTNLVGIISKNLIPVLGSATVAWIAYKVAMLEANGGFMTMGGLIMPLLGKITALKDGVIAASKAILASSTALTTLTGGLALLATGLIAYNHGVKLKEQMDEEYVSAQELSDAYSSLSDRMETLATVKERVANETNDLTSLEVLVAKMDSANTSLERRLDLQENINAQLKRYADEYPDLRGILLDENRSYEDRIEYLKQILELQKEEALNEAKKAVENGTMSDYGTSIKEKMVQMGASTLMKDDEAEEALRVQTLESAIMKQYNEAANRIETLKTLLADGAISQEYYQAELDGFKAITKELENNATFAKYFGKEVEESTGRIIEKTVNVKEAIASVFNKDYEVSSYSQALDDLRRAMEDTEGSAADSQEAIKSLSQVFPEMEGHITNLEEAVNYLANQAMLELASKADEVNTILTQMASEGFTGFDTSSAQELLKMYPELANHIQDTAYVQEFLNEKVRAYQDEINNIAENGNNAWGAYYDSVLAQDEEFWNTKLKNSDQWVAYEKIKQDEMCKFGAKILGIEEQDFADYIDAKGGFRAVDYTNCENAAQAEATLNNSLVQNMINWFADYVTEKGGYRQTDMINVAEFLNKQGVKEAKTVDDLKTMWADFYAAKKKAINAEIKSLNKKVDEMNEAGFKLDSQEGFEDMIMGNNGVSGAAKHHFSQLASDLASVNQLDEDISNFFEAVDTTFSSIGSDLSQISATADKIGTNLTGGGSGGSGSKPSGGSGSGGSGSGSGSERTVEDMELEIDRYYAYQDAIENVNKALAKNQALQENVTTKAEYKKLIEEEIDLTNQKIKALENLRKEQEKERDELKTSLKSNGFTFDSNNNITNYAERLKQLQNWANSITNPDQKEAAIAQVNAIKEMINKYTELEDSTIPATTEEINGLKNEIISINKELEENMKLIDALGDRYFDLLRKIAKVDNALALNQAKQDNANDYERIDLLGKEIELLSERQQLIREQRDEANEEANELKNQLSSKGVEFDDDGSITNYEALVKSLEDKANGLVGGAQSEAVEDAQEILDLIDKYVTLTEDTLPSLDIEWEKYTTQIQNSKDAIDEIFRSFKQTVTDVQKDIASAYEKYQTERYNKLQESLDKEIELYNKAYEEENFNRDLSEQQRELEEIAQQIAIYSRDTSEAGKARLEQLKKEYEQQQQAINDMIRDKEKDNANDRFDEVSESLDKELEDLLSPEKLVATVNDAISSGMITIGEETIKLDDLMTTWLNDTGDGLYALGDILKSELLGNLEKAQDIIGNMNVNGFTMEAPTTTNEKLQSEIDKLKNTSVNGDMNFSLVVQGDITKDSMPKLEKELQNMENRIYANIAKSLK